MTLDAAIVGGGIAGLYAAWRLTRDGRRNIHLFEASSRLGGRIKTVRTSQGGWPVELGAQSVRGDHRLLIDLLGTFAIPIAPLRTGSDGLAHFRGRTRSITELRRARWRKPFRYDVQPKLQRGVGRLLAKAFGDEEAPEASLGECLRERLSADEIAYLTDISGYGFWRDDVNARETMRWWRDHLSAGGRELYAVPGGLDTLVQKMAKDFVARGGTIHIGTSLSRIELRRGGACELTFGVEGSRKVHANSTILALPAAAVAAIDGLGAITELGQLLGDVERRRVFSAALVYESCWWRSLGFETGVTVTDLPLGVLTHFGAESWRSGTSGEGVISIFADGEHALYWTNKVKQYGHGFLDKAHPAVRDMQRMMAEIYRPRLGSAPPAPLACFFTDWSASRSGAAYHLWRAGSRPTQTASLALKPSEHTQLHICGEAWSTNQAWIEGALESTRQMLDRYFAMPRP